MIKVENLSFSFPQKELYKNISFTFEEAQHCAFIGTSGSGKSTLIDILMDPERYLFEGKLEIDPDCRIGHVSQFLQLDKTKEMTVFEYIGEEFIKIQNEITVYLYGDGHIIGYGFPDGKVSIGVGRIRCDRWG